MEDGLTILNGRGCPIPLRRLMPYNEHGDSRAVFALVPHLLSTEFIRLQPLDLRRSIYAPLIAVVQFIEVILSDNARIGEPGEGDEEVGQRTSAV